MSKRAEELARQLTGLAPELYNDGSRIQRNTQERLTAAIALIDAELRNDRECSAERIRSKDRLHIGSSGLISIDDACAAILAEEED